MSKMSCCEPVIVQRNSEPPAPQPIVRTNLNLGWKRLFAFVVLVNFGAAIAMEEKAFVLLGGAASEKSNAFMVENLPIVECRSSFS